MAKRKKKRTGSKPAPQKVPTPNKSSLNWKPIAVICIAVLLAVAALIIAIRAMGQDTTDQPTGTEGTGITSPVVDTTDLTPMRIVKPGNAYITPDKNSPTVFSFRKGDRVDMVSREGQWTMIAVEGRGYYLPNESLRALDEYLIVIDPGHQMREDHGKEAIGPGGAETATKMDVGHTGTATGQQEYELNLAIAKKLRTVLEQRGYTVNLTHSNPSTNSSYRERAEVANNVYADAYISIHAASAEDSAVKGMYTMCQSKDNTYIGGLYAQNKELSTLLLDAMVAATNATKLDIQETDKRADINWCQVPASIVHVGHLSNADEDRLMTTEDYQQKLAEGIANGLDQFFAEDEK